jgi:hypothetical protein
MGEITSAKFLRALPSPVGPLPAFDPETPPAAPDPLFESDSGSRKGKELPNTPWAAPHR